MKNPKNLVQRNVCPFEALLKNSYRLKHRRPTKHTRNVNQEMLLNEVIPVVLSEYLLSLQCIFVNTTNI